MRRILIIDDENDVREVAKVSLEVAGDWEVLTASSGPEGLSKARTEQPDVILLDVMMPGMDGPAAIEILRSDTRTEHIPVILFTAKTQAAERRLFAGLGAAAVIAKPFDPLALASQVAEIVDGRR
jgi:CheY-like chemotaxis protein